AVALFFAFSKLPEGKNNEAFEKANKASTSLFTMTLLLGLIIVIGHFSEISKLTLLLLSLISVVGVLFYSNSMANKNSEGWGAMKYQQLI
ncbi:hypothetical protein ABTK20_20675, partial [Acinetobacter baumannii]